MHFLSHSESETISFAKKFARTLKGGEVLLLIGDLGAGKTTFTKGLALGLGIKKHITSPTFVLMKIYNIPLQKSVASSSKSVDFVVNNSLTIKTLVHIDTYRGLSLPDLENIGALEYFGKNDTVSVVEWGAGLEDYCRQNKINCFIIKIKNESETGRSIDIHK